MVDGLISEARLDRFKCHILLVFFEYRLRNFMDLIVHRHQSYCVPDRSIEDDLFLIRNLLDVFKLHNIDFG